MFNKKKKNESTNMENNEENLPVSDLPTPEDTEITSEQTTDLSPEEKFQQEKSELNDKYLRLFAEFDNYKRRTQRERVDLLQTASKDVVIALLPVLDDFDRALKATESISDQDPVKEGVILIQNKLKSILSQRGLKEIESTSTAFDTDLHEAITNIAAPTDDLKGKVMDTLEKGYTLNDKVIRFAKVVVGS